MTKLSSNPWSKFFWNDWESDPALRVCTLAAQGLWMRMLCLAAKADPVGHVKIGSNPCTVQDLARLVGESEETVAALLGELERAGVYSRTRTGTIYNRRMTDDAKRSATNRQNGKKGGEASVRKQTGIFQSPKRPSERDDERPCERPSEPHKPEAKSHKPEKEKTYAFSGQVVRITQADLDRWRTSYPNVLDITAQLQAADDYYAGRDVRGRDLFFAVSTWLRKENDKTIARRKEATRGDDWW